MPAYFPNTLIYKIRHRIKKSTTEHRSRISTTYIHRTETPKNRVFTNFDDHENEQETQELRKLHTTTTLKFNENHRKTQQNLHIKAEIRHKKLHSIL